MSTLTVDVLHSAARSSSASLHEAAGKIGALPASIKPLAATMRVCGSAFPVRSPGGDNLWLHRAIYEAQPGDVLVIDTSGGIEFGYWGEIMTLAAQERSLAGLVLTGGVRDSLRLVEMGFPVFSATVCIRGTGKDPQGDGALGAPVTIGGVRINRGDLVFGDADGVVVLPAARAADAVANAHERDAAEGDIIKRLRAGETTIRIYGLPT